jgi:hypothetical protein
LDGSAAGWIESTGLKPVAVHNSIFWISSFAFKECWQNFHELVIGTSIHSSPSLSDAYVPSTNITHLEYATLIRRKVLPGSNAQPVNVQREAVFEIQAELVAEIGIRDPLIASDIAVRLVGAGCESWKDVCKLPTLLSYLSPEAKADANQAMISFFLQLGISKIMSSKLVYFISSLHRSH